MKKTDKKGKDSESKLSKIAKTGLKIGAGVVAGTTAAIGGLMAVATKSAQATDRIDKMSQKLGLSREGFQEWDYILSQNGVSIDSMKGGMKTLTNQVDELSKGGKVATDAFGELGLSYDDLAGKSQEEIFEMTVNALQGMEDETKRAAIANDVLGRSGQELAPLLNAGAGSAEELRKQAHDLGIVLGDEAIDSGVLFTDTMDNVKRSLGAMGTQIGVEVMPIVQKLLDWVIANMPTIKKVMSTVFNAIGVVVTKVIDIFKIYLLPVFQSIFDWIQRNWPTISKIATTVFAIVGTVVITAINIIKTAFNGLQSFVKTVKRIFNSIKDAITGPIETAKKIISGIIEAIKKFFNFKVSLPKIKLPHFAVKPAGWKIGDLLKGQIPKLGIDWYAEGGIFEQPTIFNTPYGLKGVGDARSPEVVTPLHKLKEMLNLDKQNQSIVNNFNVEGLVVREEADIKKIAQKLFDLQESKKRARGYA